MRPIRMIIACIAGLLIYAQQSPAVENAIERWAAAVGGRERIAAINAVYREGTIQVAGFKGSIRVWHTAEGKYRKEEQVATFSTIETFDGNGGMATQNGSAPHEMQGVELQQTRSRRFANSSAMLFVFFPDRH